MQQLFVAAPSGWSCTTLGIAPFSQFECIASDDLQIDDPANFLIQAQPAAFFADTLELTVATTSATDDPNVGLNSNSILVFSNLVSGDPNPLADMVFKSPFE